MAKYLDPKIDVLFKKIYPSSPVLPLPVGFVIRQC